MKDVTEALQRRLVAGFVFFLFLRLLFFAETGASAWADEGASLLAAQLINAGARPYFDFECPQPPSYFYLLAWWIRLFGQTWRSAHLFSALLSGGAMALVAAYVFSRLREDPWRLPASLLAAALTGLHPMVLRAGSIGQYYGLLLLLMGTAYWLTVSAVTRTTYFPILPGLVTGAALSTSFLSAPMAPILLIWTVARSSAAERWRRCAWFLAGTAIPFIPLFWMALHGFFQVLYNALLYHPLYRSYGSWRREDIPQWNLKVYAEWATNPWNFIPFLLAVFACWRASRSSASVREEGWLCCCLAAGLGIYLVLPQPTFIQYSVLVVPFLSILAAFGVSSLGARVWPWPSPRVSATVVALFLLVSTARFIAQRQWRALQSGEWHNLELAASRVDQVTASGAPIYTSINAIYFAAGRTPPVHRPLQGTSYYPIFWDEPPSNVSPRAALLLHLTLQEEFDRRLTEGQYDTAVAVVNSADARRIDLASVYVQKETIGHYVIFWERLPGRGR